MMRFWGALGCVFLVQCGSSSPQIQQESASANLSDFQGSFCDQGNYGSLWELLTWTRDPRPEGSRVAIRINPETSTLQAQHTSQGKVLGEEEITYEYRAPWLWIQRHFEVSGWPQRLWMRLGANESGLLVVPPEEEPEAPYRSHLRMAPGGNCGTMPPNHTRATVTPSRYPSTSTSCSACPSAESE